MTELLRPDAVGVARAAALLHQGLLVAFGTETVYGLGADATNDCAVAAIFTAKERPWFNPLICHYADDDAALGDVVAHDQARRLATAFWPGPLTLVLTRRPDCAISRLASGGLDTLAVRVPEHHVARSLLREAGVPVAAPSANRSGRVSPTTAEHALDELSGAHCGSAGQRSLHGGSGINGARPFVINTPFVATRRRDSRSNRGRDW